jgi:hypothetical protein
MPQKCAQPRGSTRLQLGAEHTGHHLAGIPRRVDRELLDFIARTRFPAEKVTTVTADWDDAPSAYTVHTTKLVLRRDPVGTSAPTG